MFDNIGRDLDSEAGPRRRHSLIVVAAITALLSGMAVIATSGGTVHAAQVESDDPLNYPIDTVISVDMEVPLPPPPLVRRGRVDSGPDDPVTVSSDHEMTETVSVLEDEVSPEVKAETEHSGGRLGDPEGDIDGMAMGDREGSSTGTGLRSDVRAFHHTELRVKRRRIPSYPRQALMADTGVQVCRAKVWMDGLGVPYQVEVNGCPTIFHEPTREGLMSWRWYPPTLHRQPVSAQTEIGVRFIP